MQPKRNKFNAQATMLDGVRFDSKREAARWAHLQILQKAGLISDLERQVRYRLEVGGQLICAYVADFRYLEGGVQVVEDVKSEPTRKRPEYRIKAKLMRAIHGITIREVT